jgi:hypothetical protein
VAGLEEARTKPRGVWSSQAIWGLSLRLMAGYRSPIRSALGFSCERLKGRLTTRRGASRCRRPRECSWLPSLLVGNERQYRGGSGKDQSAMTASKIMHPNDDVGMKGQINGPHVFTS